MPMVEVVKCELSTSLSRSYSWLEIHGFKIQNNEQWNSCGLQNLK